MGAAVYRHQVAIAATVIVTLSSCGGGAQLRPPSTTGHTTTKPGTPSYSDGVDSALAVAYGRRRDRRIRAAIGLSEAESAAFTGFSGGSIRSVQLRAVQRTADSVNSPSGTYSYFVDAPRPKYLLKLPAPSIAPVAHTRPRAVWASGDRGCGFSPMLPAAGWRTVERANEKAYIDP